MAPRDDLPRRPQRESEGRPAWTGLPQPGSWSCSLARSLDCVSGGAPAGALLAGLRRKISFPPQAGACDPGLWVRRQLALFRVTGNFAVFTPTRALPLAARR